MYRMRIGSYKLSGTRKSNVFRFKSANNMENYFKLSSQRNSELSLKERVLSVVFYIFLLYAVIGTGANSGGEFLQQKKINSNFNFNENEVTFNPTIFQRQWGSGLSINKLCHIKNGNIR